jgi:hypothetical protein
MVVYPISVSKNVLFLVCPTPWHQVSRALANLFSPSTTREGKRSNLHDAVFKGREPTRSRRLSGRYWKKRQPWTS